MNNRKFFFNSDRTKKKSDRKFFRSEIRKSKIDFFVWMKNSTFYIYNQS
jgi:hypothetical protein